MKILKILGIVVCLFLVFSSKKQCPIYMGSGEHNYLQWYEKEDETISTTCQISNELVGFLLQSKEMLDWYELNIRTKTIQKKETNCLKAGIDVDSYLISTTSSAYQVSFVPNPACQYYLKSTSIKKHNENDN